MSPRRLDQPDDVVVEALARLGGHPDLEPIGHHPRAAGHRRAVAAALANYGGRFPGDGGLIDLGDALDDFAVRRDGIFRLDEHDLARAQRMAGDRFVQPGQIGIVRQDEQFGRDFAPERAQVAGASFAARLGHGLSEAGKEDREPAPGGDLAGEGCQGSIGYEETPNEEEGGQHGRHLDHEHDRVGDEHARVEPAQGRPRGLSDE